MHDTVTWVQTPNISESGLCKSGIQLLPPEHDDGAMMTALSRRGDVPNCEIEIPMEAIPDLIEKLESMLPWSTDAVNDLLTNAEKGDMDAGQKLSDLFDQISHGFDCAYRHHHGAAECDCIRNRIWAALDLLDIELG